MNPTIAHYQSTFLKSSENWIAAQIDATVDYKAIVLTKKLRNRDLFESHVAYALEHAGSFERLYNRSIWNLLDYAPYFAKVCERERVRAIHAWFGYSGVAMLGVARKLSVPLITSFLGSDYTRGNAAELRRRYRKLFAHGALFLAEGPAALARLQSLGCPPEKLRVARIAIDVFAIAPYLPVRQPDEPLHILMAARFTEKKGLPYGVEGFCRFLRTGARGRLTIVGSGDDDEGAAIKSEIERIVRQFDCAESVCFAGWRDRHDLLRLAAESHVFLHPSVTASNGDAEGGHPVVFTEMAAAGLPIIATRHCDIPQILHDQQNGWLVEERDVAGITAALEDAYRFPEKLLDFSRYGRSLVERTYDITKNRLDEFYRKLQIT